MIFNFSSKTRFLKPLKGLCNSEERKFLYFGCLTNLLAPINLHNPHWEYYHYTNILSTVLYSVLSLITIVTAMFSDTYLIIPKDINKEEYIIINAVLLGSVWISGGIFYGIFCLIYKQNLPRLLLWACKSGKADIALKMLEKEGIEWNSIDSDGHDALYFAQTNQYEIK